MTNLKIATSGLDEEQIINPIDAPSKKYSLLRRLTLATCLLIAGVTGCSSNTNVDNKGTPIQASTENDLEGKEREMDNLREKLGLSPLNSLDASGLEHSEAQKNLTPEERNERLKNSNTETSNRLSNLNEGNPNFKFIQRNEAPSYQDH